MELKTKLLFIDITQFLLFIYGCVYYNIYIMVYFIDVFTVKRRLRNYRREMSHKRLKDETEEVGLKTRSGRVVLTAIGMYVFILLTILLINM